MQGTKKKQKALMQKYTATLAYLRAHYRRRALALGVVILVLVLAAAVLGALRLANGYWPWASEEVQQAAEVERIVAAVAKHILLPENETPLVATITDAATLTEEQPFYIGAIDGDQLLLYGESLRAIIYSPSRNIIVNVGPVELPQEPAAEFAAPTPAADEPVAPLVVPETETDTDTPEEPITPEPEVETEPTP